MNRWIVIVVLVIATGATYWRAARFGFTTWDDPDTIASNPRLHPPSAEALLHYWRYPAGGLYIPVTYTWWTLLAIPALEQAADGRMSLRPQIYHCGNVALHAVASLLVFAILRQVFGRDLPASVGALLFALHPVQVESVAWASGAKDLLAAMFSLIMIDQFLRFAGPDAQRRRLKFCIGVAAFALAVLSKPSAVVAPLMVGVLIRARFGVPTRRITRWVGPMLVLAVACVIWSRLAQAQYPPTDTPLWARPLIAADAIAFYVYKLFLPIDLAIIYGRTPSSVLASGSLYYAWIVPFGVAVALWLLRRRAPWLGVGGIVFVVGLLPVLGFARFMFQIHSTVADHYLYLPMLGVAVAAGGLVTSVPRTWGVAGSGVVLIVLAALSTIQLRHWHDSESLYLHALRVRPDTPLVRALLAQTYLAQRRFDDAIEQCRRVVDLAPESRLAHANLAHAYLLAGREDDAIAEADSALRLAGGADNTSWEHFILGRAFMARGMYDRAVHHFTQRLRQDPHEAAALDLAEARRRIADSATRPTTLNAP